MTDQTGATGPNSPARRWPKILLAVSLTLNLLVLGLVAGAHLRDERDVRRFPPPDRSVMRQTGFGPFFEAMPREARNRMGAALRGREQVFAQDRAALAAEFSEMIALLKAEPFDPAAFTALLSDQRARANARIEAGQAVLIDQITAMSPAERRTFAEQLDGRFARALDRSGNGGENNRRD